MLQKEVERRLTAQWQIHAPVEITSAGGAALTTLADASVLASRNNPDRDLYAAILETNQAKIVALRLETLPQKPLANSQDRFLDFEWRQRPPAPGVPANHFAVEAKKTLELSQGTYRVRAVVDDGMRVYVDEQLIIDDWHAGGVREVSRNLELAAGTHYVRVEYFQGVGDAVLKFLYHS